MRKADLSVEQRLERDRFVDRVIKCGWHVSGWEVLFAGGADLTPEAQAEYRNEVSELRLSFDVAPRRLRLECASRSTPDAVTIVLCPNNSLEQVLQPITSLQDNLSVSVVRQLLPTLRPACKEAYVDTSVQQDSR